MMRQTGTLLGTAIGLGAMLAAPFVAPAGTFAAALLAVVVITACLTVLLVFHEPYPTVPIMVLAVLFGAAIIPLYVFAVTLAIMLVGELAARYADGTLMLARRRRRVEVERRFEAGEVPPVYLWFFGAALGAGLAVSWALGKQEPLIVLMGVVVAVLLLSLIHI